MIHFKNKKILLIAPIFFGYHLEIAKNLELLGSEVDLIADRPFNGPLIKAGIRYAGSLFSYISDRYFIKYVEENKDKKYDFIFVIQGESLSKNSLKYMRSIFPDSKFILYLWDSLRNKKKLSKLFNFYDSISTFDPLDAESYGLNYRPLFYIPCKSKVINNKFLYIVNFVGTCHSDRFPIIKKFASNIKNYGDVFIYMYLQAKFVFWFNKFFNPAFKNAKYNDFEYKPIPSNDLKKVIENSFAIIDIEHPNQIGLTMRTFEALGSCKKLITTNSNIANEAFYNQNNIFILERNGNSIPPLSFFNTPFHPMPKSFEDKYTINGWIFDIFNSLR